MNISNLNQSHPFRQWLLWDVPDTNLTIEGYSRAGDKTFFYIPQLKICLDASLAEGRQGDYVLITHSHSDHIADIEYLASKNGVNIYAPKEMTAVLDNYITARKQLNHSGAYQKALDRSTYTIHGVQENDSFSITHKRSHYTIKVLNCQHAVPCVGYAFEEQRQRLKPALEQKKQEMLEKGEKAAFGKLLASQKKAGIDIYEYYQAPLFVYMGDTHASVYETQDWLWNSPFIMTECTYIFPENLDKADQRKHSHWEQLRPVVLAQPKTTFVLIHFSLRHSDETILQFFEQEKAIYGFDNVRLWLSSKPALSQQGQSS